MWFTAYGQRLQGSGSNPSVCDRIVCLKQPPWRKRFSRAWGPVAARPGFKSHRRMNQEIKKTLFFNEVEWDTETDATLI
ncbi:hypothetical protein BaRGS_00008465, partial [Batillaria attramentaria]